MVSTGKQNSQLQVLLFLFCGALAVAGSPLLEKRTNIRQSVLSPFHHLQGVRTDAIRVSCRLRTHSKVLLLFVFAWYDIASFRTLRIGKELLRTRLHHQLIDEAAGDTIRSSCQFVVERPAATKRSSAFIIGAKNIPKAFQRVTNGCPCCREAIKGRNFYVFGGHLATSGGRGGELGLGRGKLRPP